MTEVYVVTATPYPGRATLLHACFTDRDKADRAFDDAAASGQSRVRLWARPVTGAAEPASVAMAWYQVRGAHAFTPGPDRPVRDTAALVTLDSTRPLKDVLDALLAALDEADPTGWQGEISEITPVPLRNAVRAAGLRQGLVAYANQVGNIGEDARAVIQDLLTDLHHLTTLFGPGATLPDLVAAAARRFDEEVHGQP